MSQEAKTKEVAARARKLAKEKLHGILATQSVAMPGFPFGFLVQYAFDDNGDLILYLAKISQHTRNVAKDDKVSIAVIEVSAPMGNAIPVNSVQMPQATSLHQNTAQAFKH